MNRKISIIIPVYNAEKHINRCLESIINQTYTNLEIICINDGSQDKSLEILNEFKMIDERIVIIDKKNEGVSTARNLGIAIATGEFITFCDADDWVEYNAYESLMKYQKEKDYDVLRGGYKKIDENHNIISEASYLNIDKEYVKNKNMSELAELLIDDLECFTCLLIIKREILIKNHILFKEKLKFCEDVVFYNELISIVENIRIVDYSYYYYFINQDSVTNNPKYLKSNLKDLIIVYSYLNKKNDFKNNILEIKYFQKMINFLYLMCKEKIPRKEMKKVIQELYQSDDVKNLLSTLEMNMFCIKYKLFFYTFKEQRFNSLFILIKISSVLKKNNKI